MDLNKATLIGNVAREPETKKLSSGQHVTKVVLATNFVWKDKNSSEKKTKTDFHNVIGWHKLGENMAKYLKKGDKVYFEGRIDNRIWEDQEKKKHYYTDIVASSMNMLGAVGKKADAEKRAQDAAITEELPTVEAPF